MDATRKAVVAVALAEYRRSKIDLVAEQQADAYLKEIFPLVRPEEELFDSACGYFLQDSLL
ncbi:unnamed protein product, partial [Boreogadus saida]